MDNKMSTRENEVGLFLKSIYDKVALQIEASFSARSVYPKTDDQIKRESTQRQVHFSSPLVTEAYHDDDYIDEQTQDTLPIDSDDEEEFKLAVYDECSQKLLEQNEASFFCLFRPTLHEQKSLLEVETASYKNSFVNRCANVNAAKKHFEKQSNLQVVPGNNLTGDINQRNLNEGEVDFSTNNMVVGKANFDKKINGTDSEVMTSSRKKGDTNQLNISEISTKKNLDEGISSKLIFDEGNEEISLGRNYAEVCSKAHKHVIECKNVAIGNYACESEEKLQEQELVVNEKDAIEIVRKQKVSKELSALIHNEEQSEVDHKWYAEVMQMKFREKDDFNVNELEKELMKDIQNEVESNLEPFYGCGRRQTRILPLINDQLVPDSNTTEMKYSAISSITANVKMESYPMDFSPSFQTTFLHCQRQKAIQESLNEPERFPGIEQETVCDSPSSGEGAVLDEDTDMQLTPLEERNMDVLFQKGEQNSCSRSMQEANSVNGEDMRHEMVQTLKRKVNEENVGCPDVKCIIEQTKPMSEHSSPQGMPEIGREKESERKMKQQACTFDTSLRFEKLPNEEETTSTPKKLFIFTRWKESCFSVKTDTESWEKTHVEQLSAESDDKEDDCSDIIRCHDKQMVNEEGASNCSPTKNEEFDTVLENLIDKEIGNSTNYLAPKAKLSIGVDDEIEDLNCKQQEHCADVCHSMGFSKVAGLLVNDNDIMNTSNKDAGLGKEIPSIKSKTETELEEFREFEDHMKKNFDGGDTHNETNDQYSKDETLEDFNHDKGNPIGCSEISSSGPEDDCAKSEDRRSFGITEDRLIESKEKLKPEKKVLDDEIEEEGVEKFHAEVVPDSEGFDVELMSKEDTVQPNVIKCNIDRKDFLPNIGPNPSEISQSSQTGSVKTPFKYNPSSPIDNSQHEEDQSLGQMSVPGMDYSDVKFYGGNEGKTAGQQMKENFADGVMQCRVKTSEAIIERKNVFSWSTQRQQLYKDSFNSQTYVEHNQSVDTSSNLQTLPRHPSAICTSNSTPIAPPQCSLRLGLSRRRHVKRLHPYVNKDRINLHKNNRQVVPNLDKSEE